MNRKSFLAAVAALFATVSLGFYAVAQPASPVCECVDCACPDCNGVVCNCDEECPCGECACTRG